MQAQITNYNTHNASCIFAFYVLNVKGILAKALQNALKIMPDYMLV